MYNKFGKVVEGLEIAGGATVELFVSLLNKRNQRLMVSQVWPDGTSATTGIELTVLPGVGPGNTPNDVANKFATKVVGLVAQPDLAQPPASSGPAATEYNTFVVLTVDDFSRHTKLEVINLDAVNRMLLTIWVDE